MILLFAGQTIGICLIFFSISRNKFSLIEKILITSLSIIVGLGAGVFIESWSALLIAFIFISISYLKNNSKIILWDIFATIYSLVAYILLSYLFTLPITILYNLMFSEEYKYINLISLITVGIIPALINYLIVYFIKKYLTKHNFKSIYDLNQKILFSIILSLSIVFLVVYTVVYSYNINGEMSNNQHLILLIMAIIIFIIFAYFSIHYMATRKKEIEQLKNDQFNDLIEYSKQIEKLYDEISGFEHDYLNIILSLETSINNNDMNGVKDIFNNVINPTRTIIRQENHSLLKIRKLELNDIKSIFSAKIIMALSYGIDVNVEIENRVNKVYMDRLSLIRILAILLDNAIEASNKTAEKQILIAIIDTEDEQIFEIRNSSLEVVNLKLINQRGFSSKGSKRGYGLSNVNDLLKNELYVTIETSQFETMFSQKLTIRKNGDDNEYHSS